MSGIKRLGIILIVLMILVCSVSISVYYQNNGKYKASLFANSELTTENDDLRSNIKQLQEKLDTATQEYEKEIGSLKQQLTDKQKELDSSPKLSQYYIGLYKSRNLKDPQNDITEELKGRTDLIPQKAELGGTMRIESVVLLSPDYAYAAYGDGHIAGHMLLKFYVSKDGNITWQLLNYSSY